MYTVTKHYPHSLGLSCVFRQKGASSHCRYLHGYAFAVTLVFEARYLDQNNWVFDFGSLKPIKAWLEATFDHTLLVARDDPALPSLMALRDLDLAQVILVDAIGCEAFAKMIGSHVQDWLGLEHREDIVVRDLKLRSCTVSEHEGNSATWENESWVA